MMMTVLSKEQLRLAPTWRCMDTSEFAELAKTEREFVSMIVEKLIDAKPHGLENVLQIIAQVCWEKSEHVRQNWGDDAQANCWSRAGRAAEHASVVAKANQL